MSERARNRMNTGTSRMDVRARIPLMYLNDDHTITYG